MRLVGIDAEPELIDPAAMATVKHELRIGDEDWADDQVQALIQRAIDRIESRTRRQVLTRRFEFHLACFPAAREFLLPRPPIASVEKVTYVDGAGALVDPWPTSEYELVTGVPKLRLKRKKQWPAAAESVVVYYTGGDGATWASLPSGVHAAITALCDHWWHRRDAPLSLEVEAAIRRLIVGDQLAEYAEG